MDDGGKIGKGLKLATNNFTLNEVKQLIAILDVKYNIKSTIHKTGAIDQYNIYILSDSMPILVKKIKPYIVPSMKYKLGNYI
jgi:ubiquinol-cytochrome c reductase cytochrome b subunit